MKIRKILGVLSILAVFIFVLTGCSKYSDIRGTYKNKGQSIVIYDNTIDIYDLNGNKRNQTTIYYERLGENLIRIYINVGVYTYYYIYDGGLIQMTNAFSTSGEDYTKQWDKPTRTNTLKLLLIQATVHS